VERLDRDSKDRALKVRKIVFARLQGAQSWDDLIQTFHVWLPSDRRCRGVDPET